LYTASGQFVGNGVNTIKFSYISGSTSFPAGPTGDAIYYLSVDLEITKGVTDGIGATPPGPWVKFSNCPFAVHNYSYPACEHVARRRYPVAEQRLLPLGTPRLVYGGGGNRTRARFRPPRC